MLNSPDCDEGLPHYRSSSYYEGVARRNSSPIRDIPRNDMKTRSTGRTMARKMAVNFMPSRHILQFGGGSRIKPDEDMPFLDEPLNPVADVKHITERRAEMIVHEMEKDENLMLDDPDTEQLRIEALRDMPQCLTVKRSVRARISATVSLKSKKKPIGNMKRLKYRLSFWWKKMRRNIRDFVFSIELWYEAIRTVEGHFGSGVATYFYFLRWLFVMGFFVSIIVVSFIVVPQVLLVTASQDNSSVLQSTNSVFMDAITGQGILANTTLFYGHYSTNVVNVIESLHYSIPFAYFFTMVIIYIGFFIILSIRMAISYRKSFIETGNDFSMIYANKVFCGWDFGIATTRAATLKSRSILNELKELLSDSLKSKQEKSCGEVFSIILMKIFFHMLVLAMLGLVVFMMWILLDDNVDWVSNIVISARNSSYKPIITATIVSLVMVLGPFIFSRLARYEDYYSPRANLFVTLIRTFILVAVVVIVLVFFWIRSDDSCWQTSLGQEIYRLIIFDCVLSLVVVPLLEFLRLMLHRYATQKVVAPEFDIARNTLGLIYNQTLLWIGLLFSPLLVAIVTVKLWLMFYVKKACVMYNCQPAGNSWRAAQTHTVFLMLVFVSQLFVILTFGYILMSKSSVGCGPFQDYDYIYLVLVNGIISQSADSSIFFSILAWVTRPLVVAFLLVFMGIFVYYFRARAIAQKSMVAIIRAMLILEAKDKEFLLSAISKVTEGEWSYNLKEGAKDSDRYEPAVSHKWTFFMNEKNHKRPSNAGYQFVDSPKNSHPWDQPSTSEPAMDWNARKKYADNVQ